MTHLTAREIEVATALGRGEKLADIARRIGVHKNVTGCYAARAREKLGLYSRHQLAAYAVSQGWTEETPLAVRDQASGVAGIYSQSVPDLDGHPTTDVVGKSTGAL